jgi:hypothetical protein
MEGKRAWVRASDDPWHKRVWGIPTGIHFAFTDRLIWEGENMIKRSAETVFPARWDFPDCELMCFCFALEAPPHHTTPRHATPRHGREYGPVTKQTARLNWKDFRLRATLYVTIGKGWFWVTREWATSGLAY